MNALIWCRLFEQYHAQNDMFGLFQITFIQGERDAHFKIIADKNGFTGVDQQLF